MVKKFNELGTDCTTVSQVIKHQDKAVYEDIQRGIDLYNTQDIGSTEALKVVVCYMSTQMFHKSLKGQCTVYKAT